MRQEYILFTVSTSFEQLFSAILAEWIERENFLNTLQAIWFSFLDKH